MRPIVLALSILWFSSPLFAQQRDQNKATKYAANVEIVLASLGDIIQEIQKDNATNDLLKENYTKQVDVLQKTKLDLEEQLTLLKKEPSDAGWLITSLGTLFMLHVETEGIRCAAVTNKFQLIQMRKGQLEQGILSGWAAQIKALNQQIIRTYALGMELSVDIVDKGTPRRKSLE